MNHLQAIEASDQAGALKALTERLGRGEDAWGIHYSLFPIVQRVMNPPFINPHMPKMYALCRDLAPYLQAEEIPALVRLEVNEYARRPKLEELPRKSLPVSPVSFREIESAIRERDREKTAALMAVFLAREGGPEFARRLLILGSGYLDRSLGHSVSCTAFILLEMVERQDQDPWPSLATLADYFCKGGFDTTPRIRKPEVDLSDEAIGHHVKRATSGLGIVNLHHTITFFAIERISQFLNKEEGAHMAGAWIAFLQDKGAQETISEGKGKPPADYIRFFDTFSGLETKAVVESIAGMIVSPETRRRLFSFITKAVIDRYQGVYNPHYLTGLASALWVVDRYCNQAPIALNALFQYLDYYFTDMKSQG